MEYSCNKYKNFSEYLKDENKIEGLDEILVDNVPLWRLVRSDVRRKLMGKSNRTINLKIKAFHQFFNHLKSIADITKILLGCVRRSNLFLPHPRLFLVNDLYMERLSDPLIDYSEIGNDYVILERHQNGIHHRPRYHYKNVYYTDAIYTICRGLTPCYSKKYKKKYNNEIRCLLDKLQSVFEFDRKSIEKMVVRILTEYFLRYQLLNPLVRAIKPQRLFLAPRNTYIYHIVYCKRNGITTIELEHGITVGDTPLYTGLYNTNVDPDYFLTFGKDNVGSQFYMPLEKVHNIGFPYKNFIKDIALEPYPENTVLVASEPTISEKIVDALSILGKEYPQCEFHIRCHPQERMSSELRVRIDEMANVKIVPNTIESFCALSQYTNVMSENSSVLYEAMSLGKKVARLNFAGLHVKESKLIHGGTIINSPEDFGRFLTEPYNNLNDSKELYSDYQSDTFKKIL